MVSEISGIMSIMKFFGTFIVMLWLTLYIQAGACAEILEEPKTQYVMIGKNAMFTCKTTGTEAFWVLNKISMTRSFPDQVQDYENKGVVFVENSSQNNHNLTMTIPATVTLNNTEISCHAIRSDYTQAFSKTVYLVVVGSSEILEEPKTQYVMIGKNAMFTCKTTGIEAFWVLNGISMTSSFPDQVQDYENKGVVFVENSSQNNHNLTVTIPATVTLNNTEISCHAIRSDYTQAFSKTVYLIVVGSSDTKKNNETQPQPRTMESNDDIAGPKILEEPKSQYVMIGENATFSCKSTGKEAFWILNNISMTITYPNQTQFYEDNGVVFKKDSSDYHYNLTMIMPGIEVLNNTVISCLAIDVDYVNTMSKEVDLVVVNTSENADS